MYITPVVIYLAQNTTPTQEEIEKEWLVEARHRAKELDEGTVQAISSEEVRKKAQALLR